MVTAHRSSLLAYLWLAFGILSVSSSAIFVRWAGAPGTVTSFYRMAIAALLLTWPVYRQNHTRDNLPRLGAQTALLGGLFFAGDLALWSTGVVLSGATNPTLLANTAPLWVGLGALIFGNRHTGGDTAGRRPHALADFEWDHRVGWCVHRTSQPETA